ncbi:aminodeoxychorismate synthase component I [Enteractinococcus fodinae]|uniref:Para-aminobenzoate synthetase n=1 Tax=Enteractinococcus fodinae TaxID=684663 RepID=A0ABU2B286_9MICC|nr:chorismate-binding protein [Enteractinococcus fodinae]MDR7347717.1 para-aminobenzoate synthetase [Enteractinococcus fodinae]
MILLIDLHGFTTHILTHQLGAVHRVTATELPALNLETYTHIVIAHGTDTVDLTQLLSLPQVPVLALGAGYQHLAAAYGHTAVGPSQPVYGQPVAHHHTATGLFTGVAPQAPLVSYHPLRLTALDTQTFTVHALDDANAVLAYRVKDTNHWGLHADPAALQSSQGSSIIENFLALAPTSSTRAETSVSGPSTGRHVEVFTRTVAGLLNTPATFRRLQEQASASFWLDSAAAHRGQGDTTIMGTNDGPLAETIRWDVETNELEIHQATTTHRATGDVLEYLETHTWQPIQPVDMPGFTGGWVGYLGYEAKQATVDEHTNRWQAPTPDAYWIRPQAFLRYDHHQELTTLFAVEDRQLLDALEAALVFGTSSDPDIPDQHPPAGQWRLSATAYADRVAQIQTLLHAGQAAGICLTDTFETGGYRGEGLALYERLRVHNPAPYAGYLRFNTFGDALEVLSASPEKFLGVDATGAVESKPIKGTVARSSDPTMDAQVANRMATDPKFQSENLMITDLLRDDLAKVTVPGSVQVPKLMAIETFATVHQLVTTVTGQLRPEISAAAALRAVFPGGSMTGAPKLASLDALESIEAGPRGIYSGAMGWLGDNNTAEFNVIIRSMILADGVLTIGAGGAVVVASQPVEEEQEKRLKAQALLDILAEGS